MRTCPKCGERDAIELDPRWCRECRNAYHAGWYHAHRAEQVERMRVSRQENPERQRGWQNAYDKRHPGRRKEHSERSKRKHAEEIRHRQREAYQMNPEKYREYQQLWRARNRDKVNARSRELHTKNREARNAQSRDWKRRHFFYERSRKWEKRNGYSISAFALWSLWKKQRGRCALTDRTLDGRSIHGAALDHIIARVVGGSGDVKNLRWLCYEANVAKGILTDKELMRLCCDILSYDWDKQEASGHFDALPLWAEELKCGIGLPA